MTSADSIKIDTTALFYTVKGRRVYGGGGIIPDIFVPIDTTRASNFFINCNKKAVQMRFASHMFDKYRSELSSFDNFASLEKWIDSIDMEGQFLSYAARVEKLSPKTSEWEATKSYMMPQLKALVGRYSKLDDEAFYRFYLPIDETIQIALKSSSRVE
jgi:carboxyl-terminal processing protease